MGEIDFAYLPEDTYAHQPLKLAHNLNVYPVEDVLSAPFVYGKYDPNVIHSFLTQLANPANVLAMVGSNEYEYSSYAYSGGSEEDFLNSLDLDTSDPLYRLEYSVRALRDIKKTRFHFELPPKNSYIPQDLSLKSLCHKKELLMKSQQYFYKSLDECYKHEKQYESQHPYPILLQNNIQGKLWWRLDRTFRIPQVFVGLRLRKHFHTTNEYQMAKLELLNAYFRDSFQNKLYQPKEAGYEAYFYADHSGISLVLYGWSDQFEHYYKDLLKEVHRSLYSHQDEAAFARIKSDLLEDQKNAYEKRLYNYLTQHYLDELMIHDHYSPRQIAGALRALDFRDFQDFTADFLRHFRFNVLAYGNILRSQATHLVTTFNVLLPSPHPLESLPRKQVPRHPPKATHQSRQPHRLLLRPLLHQPFLRRQRHERPHLQLLQHRLSRQNGHSHRKTHPVQVRQQGLRLSQNPTTTWLPCQSQVLSHRLPRWCLYHSLRYQAAAVRGEPEDRQFPEVFQGVPGGDV